MILIAWQQRCDRKSRSMGLRLLISPKLLSLQIRKYKKCFQGARYENVFFYRAFVLSFS